MPSTFFGLNIASSALHAFQIATNTTANNISNVQTKGYSKQVATREASEALRVYQKYGTAGSGVTTTSIKAARSTYYDMKYWNNQAYVGHYDVRVNYLGQIENHFVDEGSTEPGFSTIFANMFNELNGLASDGGNEERRKGFISQAQILATYFHSVANGLSDIQKDCNEQIKVYVESINSASAKIASLTKQINAIEVQGGWANELRDQRALVIDELSEIVPITVEETPVTNSNYPDMYLGGTNFLVKLDGETIVSTYDYRSLSCVSRENTVYQTDVEGLYDIVWDDTGMKFNAMAKSMAGTLKALFEIRDGNNAENFQGKVLQANPLSVVIKPSTMDTVESMTMAAEGIITIRNKEYYYTGFSAEIGEDGKIASYKFNLKEGLDASEMSAMIGQQSKIGATIDAKGIPYYMGQMSEFLRSFSERFNAFQRSGADLNNDPMGSFFIATGYNGTEYDFAEQLVSTDGVTAASSKVTSESNSYYQMNALNFNVADASVRDSKFFATAYQKGFTEEGPEGVTGDKIDRHDLVDDMLKLQKDVMLFRGGSAEDFLHCIYSDISIDTHEADVFQSNYTDIASAITNQRLSISGVDEDEEALDIVKFQNAYNLASRMIQCMAEMYDKLINETGV